VNIFSHDDEGQITCEGVPYTLLSSGTTPEGLRRAADKAAWLNECVALWLARSGPELAYHLWAGRVEADDEGKGVKPEPPQTCATCAAYAPGDWIRSPRCSKYPGLWLARVGPEFGCNQWAGHGEAADE